MNVFTFFGMWLDQGAFNLLMLSGMWVTGVTYTGVGKSRNSYVYDLLDNGPEMTGWRCA